MLGFRFIQFSIFVLSFLATIRVCATSAPASPDHARLYCPHLLHKLASVTEVGTPDGILDTAIIPFKSGALALVTHHIPLPHEVNRMGILLLPPKEGTPRNLMPFDITRWPKNKSYEEWSREFEKFERWQERSLFITSDEILAHIREMLKLSNPADAQVSDASSNIALLPTQGDHLFYAAVNLNLKGESENIATNDIHRVSAIVSFRGTKMMGVYFSEDPIRSLSSLGHSLLLRTSSSLQLLEINSNTGDLSKVKEIRPQHQSYGLILFYQYGIPVPLKDGRIAPEPEALAYAKAVREDFKEYTKLILLAYQEGRLEVYDSYGDPIGVHEMRIPGFPISFWSRNTQDADAPHELVLEPINSFFIDGFGRLQQGYVVPQPVILGSARNLNIKEGARAK